MEDNNIYSSLPEEIKKINKIKRNSKEQIEGNKRLLKEYFDAHIGHINVMKGEEIAKRMGWKISGHNVYFRFIVSKLVEEDLYPIVSCHEGYYKASKQQEIQGNINVETARIQGIQKRIDALNKISSMLSQIEAEGIQLNINEKGEISE